MSDRPFKPTLPVEENISITTGGTHDAAGIDMADYKWAAVRVTCTESHTVLIMTGSDPDGSDWSWLWEPQANADWSWAEQAASATGNTYLLNVAAVRAIKVRIVNHGLLTATANVYVTLGY